MSQDEYFSFVQALAQDLNDNEIHLPSFPDVVIRVRSALDDPETTNEDLATILSVDAALASRILVLANSTYHNPAGIPVEGLAGAIGRIGFGKVRTAAIAYAVEQLYASEKLVPLKKELGETWSAGLRLAALSEVIASRCRMNPDSGFIAGLLHNIGALYIFTKYEDYPALLGDRETLQNLLDEWAPAIGESIVANWGFPEEIQATINPQGVDLDRGKAEANLVDVVTAAKECFSGEEFDFPDTVEARRLDLTEDQLPAVADAYQKKLESLLAVVK